jgi:hypothetical protein
MEFKMALLKSTTAYKTAHITNRTKCKTVPWFYSLGKKNHLWICVYSISKFPQEESALKKAIVTLTGLAVGNSTKTG